MRCRQEFRGLGVGVFWTIFVVIALGLWWQFLARSPEIAAVRYQTDLLWAVSGHQDKVWRYPETIETAKFIRSFAEKFASGEKQSLDITAANIAVDELRKFLESLLKLHPNTKVGFGHHPALVDLLDKHAEAFARAITGDEAPAQEWEARWDKNRKVTFLPTGLVLLLLTLTGTGLSWLFSERDC